MPDIKDALASYDKDAPNMNLEQLTGAILNLEAIEAQATPNQKR
jgi:hypothetical protein